MLGASEALGGTGSEYGPANGSLVNCGRCPTRDAFHLPGIESQPPERYRADRVVFDQVKIMLSSCGEHDSRTTKVEADEAKPQPGSPSTGRSSFDATSHH
jgi:hypothetical protein